MIYICNSFSPSMLDAWRLEDTASETHISVTPVSDPRSWLEDAEQRHGNAVSAVGHADTATLFSAILGRPVEFNRISAKLDESAELLVGQLVGTRPPEGCTTLPEDATIRWLSVAIYNGYINERIGE